MRLNISSEIFSSALEIKRAAYNILQKYQVGKKVSENDLKFLKELFSYHPTGQAKLEGMTGIMVGVHKDSEKETLCFIIEKDKEMVDISYIKAVNGFIQTKENTSEQEFLSSMHEVVNRIIDIIIQVLEDNPLMYKFVKHQISEVFPHKSAETKVLKYFIKNLLALAEKFEKLNDYCIRICIEKLLEIECEGDIDKLDHLLYVFLEYFYKKSCLNSFIHTLSVFKSHILKTHQTNYMQHIILRFCSISPEYPELFLSLLVKEIYSHSHISAAASYVTSFLLIYPDQTTLTLKFLIYYCLKNIKKKPAQANVKCVLKYVFFLIAYKPELLVDPKIYEKLKKVFKYPLLKDIPLQEGLDYTEILSLSNYCGDLCFTTLYLPFHGDLSSLKLCSGYFNSFSLSLQSKKRRRCMSIDLPKELQLKKRSYSIDDTKILERVDCSSITTVASYK